MTHSMLTEEACKEMQTVVAAGVQGTTATYQFQELQTFKEKQKDWEIAVSNNVITCDKTEGLTPHEGAFFIRFREKLKAEHIDLSMSTEENLDVLRELKVGIKMGYTSGGKFIASKWEAFTPTWSGNATEQNKRDTEPLYAMLINNISCEGLGLADPEPSASQFQDMPKLEEGSGAIEVLD